jgi:uracil-DNA glycosylase family 4
MPADPNCKLCVLCDGRTQVVQPSGDLGSPLVLVGEAPGEMEDRKGSPFVGRAGKWLDKCLDQAQLSRSSIMITNTVRCRPPENRRPTEAEISACRPYLEQELRGRRLVVALGSTAIEGLIGRKVKVTQVVNQIVLVNIGGLDIEVLMTFHPSACIYNKDARVKLVEGLCLAKEISGLDV